MSMTSRQFADLQRRLEANETPEEKQERLRLERSTNRYIRDRMALDDLTRAVKQSGRTGRPKQG